MSDIKDKAYQVRMAEYQAKKADYDTMVQTLDMDTKRDSRMYENHTDDEVPRVGAHTKTQHSVQEFWIREYPDAPEKPHRRPNPGEEVTVKIDWDHNKGTVYYPPVAVVGEYITLYAEPRPGYRFVGWSDGVTDNPREVLVEDYIELEALFKPLLTNAFGIKAIGSVTITPSGLEEAEYSLDGEEWLVYLSPVTLANGEVCYWRANGRGTYDPAFTLDGSCSAFGNIFSLFNKSSFDQITRISERQLDSMFKGVTALKDVDAMTIPASVAADYCCNEMFMNSGLEHLPAHPTSASVLGKYAYQNMYSGCAFTTIPDGFLDAVQVPECGYKGMFSECANLTATCNLSAVGSAGTRAFEEMFKGSGVSRLEGSINVSSEYLCKSMFEGCDNLVTIPNGYLNQSLAPYCYSQMFKDCTSLKNLPTFPDAVLAEGAYKEMFMGCTGLEHIHVQALTVGEHSFEGMFNGAGARSVVLDFTSVADYSCQSMLQNMKSLVSIQVAYERESPDYMTAFDNWVLDVRNFAMVDGGDFRAADLTKWPELDANGNPWSQVPDEDKCLYLTSPSDFGVKCTVYGDPSVQNIEYSVGSMEGWITYVPGTVVHALGEERIYWRRTINGDLSEDNYMQFSSEGGNKLSLGGNVASMDLPVFESRPKTTEQFTLQYHPYCFYKMFESFPFNDCLHVVNTGRSSAFCFKRAFADSTADNNATKLICKCKVHEGSDEYTIGFAYEESCYEEMFRGCKTINQDLSSLEIGDESAYIILEDNKSHSFRYTFAETNITCSPTFTITRVTEDLKFNETFVGMFSGCKSLNHIIIDQLKEPNKNFGCFVDWARNVAPTGEFDRDFEAYWLYGKDGDPWPAPKVDDRWFWVENLEEEPITLEFYRYNINYYGYKPLGNWWDVWDFMWFSKDTKYWEKFIDYYSANKHKEFEENNFKIGEIIIPPKTRYYFSGKLDTWNLATATAFPNLGLRSKGRIDIGGCYASLHCGWDFENKENTVPPASELCRQLENLHSAATLDFGSHIKAYGFKLNQKDYKVYDIFYRVFNSFNRRTGEYKCGVEILPDDTKARLSVMCQPGAISTYEVFLVTIHDVFPRGVFEQFCTGTDLKSIPKEMFNSMVDVDLESFSLPRYFGDLTFNEAFYECSNLVDAPDLDKFADLLANNGYGSRTFASTFEGCISLELPPKLSSPCQDRDISFYNWGTPGAISYYRSTFKGCTKLKYAPLMNTYLNGDYCYRETFAGCTSLLDAPNLYFWDASPLECCEQMFYQCSSLTKAPDFIRSHTGFGIHSCNEMFKGCSSLVKGPQLLGYRTYNWETGEFERDWNFPEVKGLAYYALCFCSMFEGCTNLTYCTSVIPYCKTVPSYYCERMFAECHNLLRAPEFVDISVDGPCEDFGTREYSMGYIYAFREMFLNCKSLRYGPSKLYWRNYPLENTLQEPISSACYVRMFKGCESLVQAPLMPFDGLHQPHYMEPMMQEMFAGCKSLDELWIKGTGDNWNNHDNPFYDILLDASAIGTLHVAPDFDMNDFVLRRHFLPENWVLVKDYTD